MTVRLTRFTEHRGRARSRWCDPPRVQAAGSLLGELVEEPILMSGGPPSGARTVMRGGIATASNSCGCERMRAGATPDRSALDAVKALWWNALSEYLMPCRVDSLVN